MFDVTNFLMRWLFLCNLIRDCAEIQLLPHNPNTPVQPVDQTMSHPFSTEEEWREGCLRGILSYPPGSQRLRIILQCFQYQASHDSGRSSKLQGGNRYKECPTPIGTHLSR